MTEIDADDYDANVIPFPRGQFEKRQNEREAALDELPVRLGREPRACRHERSTVDAAARTLVCRDCEVSLDPIDVLASLAQRREQLVNTGRMLRSEVDHLRDRVAELERQERNAKSRIKRARTSSPYAPAIEEAAKQVGIRRNENWDGMPNGRRLRLIEEARAVVEEFVAACEKLLAEKRASA